MRLLSIAVVASCIATTAWAQNLSDSQDATTSVEAGASPSSNGDAPGPSPQHPAAKIYSSGYETRAKIHKYASIATLPLFATELWLGQSLYNNPSTGQGSRKGAHIAVGSGIIGLFGVNTVTGAWNMWESRKDPDGRTLRMVHGVLMMASNAGFLATAATGPGGRGRQSGLTFAADRTTHRDTAIASISLGTAGYLIMLLRGHL